MTEPTPALHAVSGGAESGSKPRLLDLFCCAGGAARGYVDAGFEVYGVDLTRQKNYPYAFHMGDALDVLRRLLAGEAVAFTHKDGTVEHLRLLDFDAVHTSPPCQAYSITKHSHGNAHPELIEPVREALRATGLPYVIENVVGAPLVDPLTLCGTMFTLEAYDPATDEVVWMKRHRLFETNFPCLLPGPCRCLEMRRAGRQCAGTYGGGSVNRAHAKNVTRGGYTPAKAVRAQLLGIDWFVSRDQLSQAIPPAYTEWVGEQLLVHLTASRVSVAEAEHVA